MTSRLARPVASAARGRHGRLRAHAVALVIGFAACRPSGDATPGGPTAREPVAPEVPSASVSSPTQTPTPIASASAPSPPHERPEPRSALVELAPSQGELNPLIEFHVARAKEKRLAPYVEFYADWCPPCVALKKHAKDPRMIDAFDGTYLVVLNVDDWLDKLQGTGFVPKNIPVFYAIDERGRPTGRQITGAAWNPKNQKGRDVPENMAPVLKSFFAAVD